MIDEYFLLQFNGAVSVSEIMILSKLLLKFKKFQKQIFRPLKINNLLPVYCLL